MLYSIGIVDSPREGDKEWDSASFFYFVHIILYVEYRETVFDHF